MRTDIIEGLSGFGLDYNLFRDWINRIVGYLDIYQSHFKVKILPYNSDHKLSVDAVTANTIYNNYATHINYYSKYMWGINVSVENVIKNKVILDKSLRNNILYKDRYDFILPKVNTKKVNKFVSEETQSKYLYIKNFLNECNISDNIIDGFTIDRQIELFKSIYTKTDLLNRPLYQIYKNSLEVLFENKASDKVKDMIKYPLITRRLDSRFMYNSRYLMDFDLDVINAMLTTMRLDDNVVVYSDKFSYILEESHSFLNNEDNYHYNVTDVISNIGPNLAYGYDASHLFTKNTYDAVDAYKNTIVNDYKNIKYDPYTEVDSCTRQVIEVMESES